MAAAAVQPFVCGGMAACFASSCIHPIDLAKVRIQLMSTLRPDAPKIGFPNLITTMVRQEGLLRCVYYDSIAFAASQYCGRALNC
jgi:solute carrier family 25 (mitochondrial oxoglutarate transporter), member 11